MLSMSKLIRVKYKKEDLMIFISHLDLQRLLQRAFRRAKINLSYSEGFNPHPKMSYGNALALGVESQGALTSGATHVLQWRGQRDATWRQGANPQTTSQFGSESATRLREAGFASNRASAMAR